MKRIWVATIAGGGLGGWKRKRGERSEKEKRKAGRWMGGRIGGCEYTVLRGVK